jgi:hypothetical protein
MNLASIYSLTAGVPIGEPKIREEYFPLIVDNFITIQPFSKGAKSYDYWNEVIDIIIPELNKANIKIVQVGGPNEKNLKHCLHLQGQTTINQTNYILKKSRLHFGADSWCAHAAGICNKPIVALYSNNHIDNVKPYFGDKTKQILIPAPGNPVFTLDEHPKRINKINPEQIAKAILDLLGLDYVYSYNTVEIYPLYNNTMLEITPTQVVNPQHFNTDKMVVRMDYLFNEQGLVDQLKVCPCIIFTNRPINKQILDVFKKDRIHQIIYILNNDNSNVDFIKYSQSLGINTQVISYLTADEINQYKLDYCDLGIIHQKSLEIPEKLKSINVNKLHFKSGKFILHNNKFYPSYAHLLKEHNIQKIESIELPVVDSLSFWRDYEHYYFLKT